MKKQRRREGVLFKSRLVGVHWTPSEFIQEALRIGHPTDLESNVARDFIEAVDFCARSSDLQLCLFRTEEIRKWVQLACDSGLEELLWKENLSTRRKKSCPTSASV